MSYPRYGSLAKHVRSSMGKGNSVRKQSDDIGNTVQGYRTKPTEGEFSPSRAKMPPADVTAPDNGQPSRNPRLR